MTAGLRRFRDYCGSILIAASPTIMMLRGFSLRLRQG